MSKVYRSDLDVLKGIAIIAVILFHLGILKSGYLGVDVFLVINGFFIIPSLLEKVSIGVFSYKQFIVSRLLRLWPLIVLITIICLIIGYVGMLPDDYENLGESVVASNLFSENLLLFRTTNDYWNVANDYNPLMHLWYVGLLFDFYLLFPLVITAINKVGGAKSTRYTVIVLFILSLFLYILPIAEDSAKFYFLHFRLFEFLIGGLCGMGVYKIKTSKPVYYSLFVFLCVVLISSLAFFNVNNVGYDVIKLGGLNVEEERSLIFPKQIMLVLTVGVTSLLINGGNGFCINSKVLSYFGKRSYSFFIWHQALIAFYRYYFTTKISIVFICFFFIVLICLSELTYQFVERRFTHQKRALMITIFFAVVSTFGGWAVYLRAGVVRDVPELDIYKDDVQRGMHASYVDRIYIYKKDFPLQNLNKNVLIEGVSYGRDFTNVLLESQYADSVNISYITRWSPSYINRIRQADFIFTFLGRDEVPEYVFDNMKKNCRIIGIGTKNYGQTNGHIYSKRHSKDYFKQTALLHPWYRNKNEKWEKQWGNDYIDFIKIAMVDDNHIRVFTDDNKYISQDCYHLTKAGARWYASKIDFSYYLSNDNCK